MMPYKKRTKETKKNAQEAGFPGKFSKSKAWTFWLYP
jgi:hypothetical protein